MAAATDMNTEEREAFLADLHVGILAIQREGKGPLSLPIWYSYEDGDVLISMSSTSAKAALLDRFGRATMTVQNETPPYRYVSVEGPVTVGKEDIDLSGMAIRYLGAEMGAWYAKNNPPNENTVVARLVPERWLTCDYGKVM